MNTPPFEEVLALVAAGVASEVAARCADLDLATLSPDETARLDRVIAWREAQVQMRLFSRFEADASGAGMRAFEEWHTRARESRIAGGPRELTCRDIIVDDPATLEEIRRHAADTN